jgi:diacylglycerol kinase (ATP)
LIEYLQNNTLKDTPSVSGGKKRVRFIINPYSGVRKRLNLETLIAQELDATQFQFDIVYTEYAGHAIELAQEAALEGLDIVFAVGGDGSVNEVAQGLTDTNTAMGILPAGSGNGFAMYLGWGRNIPSVLRRLSTAKVEVIDTCLLNGRPFVNLAGVGFEAKVAHQLKGSKLRGLQGYAKHFFKHLFGYKFKKYQITVDNQTVITEAFTITVANAPMYGYNFVVAPSAKFNDGQLEVVIFKPANKLRYFFTTLRMLTKSINRSPLVKRLSGKQIDITLFDDDYAQVDGEGFEVEQRKLTFTVKPLSLKVLVP